MRFAGCLLLLAGPGPMAQAQFFDFLADWSQSAPADTRAFSAEITATLKSSSPWGEITTVESGKYWRNSKGQDRFDDSYGLSEMRDRRGPVIRARVDRELRSVEIEQKVASREPSDVQPWSILPFAFKIGRTQTVEGLKATVRTGEDHGVSYEVWTSEELGIVLYARYKTDHTVFEQRVHDVKFAEPDGEIVTFAVPPGFRTRITCSSITKPEFAARRQVYDPGKDLCP